MQEDSTRGTVPGVFKLLGLFVLACAVLTTGVLIGRQVEHLNGAFSSVSGTVFAESSALAVARVGTPSAVAAEMILLIGFVITLLGGWTAYVSIKALRARRDLDESKRLLRQEMERQKNTSDELHITHQQLSRTTGQLGGILEGTTDFIAAIDTSLRFITFNKAYKENIRSLFGADVGEGMSVEEALSAHPAKRDVSVRLWKRALRGEKFTALQEFTDDLGTTYHYELTYTPILNETGDVTGAAQICRDVTERKRTEERLKQEMDFVSAAIDVNSSLVMVLDLEGRIVRINQACERLSGYKFEEVRGRIFWNILIPTEDIAKIKSSYRNFDSTFFSEDYVNQWITKDEEIKLISWQVSAIKDDSGNLKYVVGTGIDITEKREFESARNRMLMILENSPDFVSIYDFQGRLAYLNPAGRSLTGLAEDADLTLIRMNSLHPPWVTEILQSEAIPTAVKKGSWLGTTALLTESGEEIPTSQLILAHQNQKGKVEYFSTVIRDISSQKNLETSLQEARDGALEAIRNKSEFLANMSHEIRTPMSGIIGISELMLGTELNEEQKDYAETIQKCGEALLTIINDILDFSKLEAGKLQFENTDLDLREMVDSVSELFTQTIYKKGLELSVLISHDVPNQLKGDPGRIRQVLTNLVSNAVKFTDKGEIVVRVKLEKESQNPLIRFAVTDTGIGISEEAQETLFLPYSQTGAKPARDYGGTGLGLAICKQIVDMLNGQIGLDSEPEKGSTFWFCVPFELQPQIGDLPELDIVRGRRVLVVDDNDTNRMSLLHQAKTWGMLADEASSAEAGLGLLKAAARSREHFEILVVDMDMPGMGGLELAEKIKDEPLLRRTRLILLASAARRSRIRKPSEKGIHAIVSKPMRHSELLVKMSDLLTDTAAQALTGLEGTPATENPLALTGEGIGSGSRKPSPRILIAEDNMVNRKVLLNQVRRLGFEVEAVSNGAEAVEAVRGGRFDLVLMDCEMPEMDGFEATRAIRALEDGRSKIPVLAVTAHVLNGERDKCLAAGMDDYLAKPTRQDSLGDMIRRWIYCSAEEDNDERAGTEIVTGGPGLPSFDNRSIEERMRELEDECGTQVVAECLQLFRLDTIRTVKRLKNALEKNDLEKVAAEAHKLKGSTANMGAPELSDLCGKLMDGAREERREVCSVLIERFTERYESLAPVYSEIERSIAGTPAGVGKRF
ncbi:MAG TPA: response regulator [Aridibacter sp.]|nr:response regulator [Aridibacter sp.]